MSRSVNWYVGGAIAAMFVVAGAISFGSRVADTNAIADADAGKPVAALTAVAAHEMGYESAVSQIQGSIWMGRVGPTVFMIKFDNLSGTVAGGELDTISYVMDGSSSGNLTFTAGRDSFAGQIHAKTRPVTIDLTTTFASPTLSLNLIYHQSGGIMLIETKSGWVPLMRVHDGNFKTLVHTLGVEAATAAVDAFNEGRTSN